MLGGEVEVTCNSSEFCKHSWSIGPSSGHAKAVMQLPARGIMLALMLLISSVALSACQTVSVGTADGHSFSGFGFYRVNLPASHGSLLAVGREGVGVGWGSPVGTNAFLGYDKSDWIIADPEQCQLLVVIRTAAQAENARQIIASIEDKSPCIVDQTGSLKPNTSR
jgi:hypothetical protein